MGTGCLHLDFVYRCRCRFRFYHHFSHVLYTTRRNFWILADRFMSWGRSEEKEERGTRQISDSFFIYFLIIRAAVNHP